ncbi:hypothetical protein C8R47DRAFT_1086492 [Mycena vitilis]|nr:hypothetical protein C8R47DRAFT_1086492 [Mycena vitilis]
MNVKVMGAVSFPGTNPARALACCLLLQACSLLTQSGPQQQVYVRPVPRVVPQHPGQRAYTQPCAPEGGAFGAFGDATNTHRCYTLRTQTDRRMAERVLDGEDSFSVLARRARVRFALREQQNSTPREPEVDAAAAAWRLASQACMASQRKKEEERWAGAPGANPHLSTTSIPISPCQPRRCVST